MAAGPAFIRVNFAPVAIFVAIGVAMQRTPPYDGGPCRTRIPRDMPALPAGSLPRLSRIVCPGRAPCPPEFA